MIYSNEDILKAMDEAYREGFEKGRIAGADSHYGEVSRIRFINKFREKLKLEPLKEPPMCGH